MKKFKILFLMLIALPGMIQASTSDTTIFTRADTIRGSILPERAWWDVLRYDITVKPVYEIKTISGRNEIKYKVLSDDNPGIMQIDLQSPMIIDSIIFNSESSLDFKRDGNAWYVSVPEQKKFSENVLSIIFHGVPKEAKFPPWDGGWVWSKDSLGNPWISVACQGLGASVWYPCKDHQSDEPDDGASLTMIIPNDLVGVSNGRLKSKTENQDGTISFKWEVTNPINNYNIVPYIGKYVNFTESYSGEKGLLDIDIWVLNYNLEKAKEHSLPDVLRMLKAFEHWFGPYPFYEDSYKLIDAPFAGMEHQSAIAYGNKYKLGFWGIDRSKTNWGLKWDYMIVHESGHEWFGNSITTNDIADMWIHEGFTDYSETLFTEYYYGKAAADEYNKGLRRTITNKKPVIGIYGVNNESGGDIYAKGSNLLHTIRHSMDDDDKFRNILRKINQSFYHQTVTSNQIENFINVNSGFDYSKVFDQYLRTVQIPVFEFYFDKEKSKVNYRYTNCMKDFNLPLVLRNSNASVKIFPSTKWNSMKVNSQTSSLFNEDEIIYYYYIDAKKVKGK